MRIALIVVLVLGLLGGLGYTLYQPKEMSSVYVIQDITDKHVSVPDSEKVVGFIQSLSGDKWSGIEFRYSHISDVSLNHVTAITLPAQNKWLSNELQRRKLVEEFYAEVGAALSHNTGSVEKNNSSVYISIAQSLNALSSGSSTRKVLIVYSDLMENEKEFSFYDASVLALLSSDFNGVKSKLDAEMPLSTLSGIEVYLVYQPLDVDADKQYRIVSGFYKKLLEEKGVVVHIVSNI